MEDKLEYYQNGNIKYKTTYFDDGVVKDELEYAEDKGGSVLIKTTYFKNDEISSEIEYYGNGNIKEEFYYNEADNYIESRNIYYDNGAIWYNFLYENNKIIETILYDKDGNKSNL